MVLTCSLGRLVSEGIGPGLQQQPVVLQRLVAIRLAGYADDVARTLEHEDLVVKLQEEWKVIISAGRRWPSKIPTHLLFLRCMLGLGLGASLRRGGEVLHPPEPAAAAVHN